jgi:hypothetical protein|tara:strand:+ start:44 stop:145 length:102 start_codon:yes stop_codon:yes gene_type:complete
VVAVVVAVQFTEMVVVQVVVVCLCHTVIHVLQD